MKLDSVGTLSRRVGEDDNGCFQALYLVQIHDSHWRFVVRSRRNAVKFTILVDQVLEMLG